MSESLCKSCAQSMQGADLVLRCRVNGHECKFVNGCKSYLYEPGTDAEESPWYKDGWCVTSSTEGRGD